MARLPALSQGLSDLYTVEGDTLISREQSWKTEIGDRSVPNAVRPHIKVRKWADTPDECWIAVNFLDNLTGSDAATFEGTVLVWSKRGYQVRLYNTGFGEGGGHNFDLVIPSRPPVNSITIGLSQSGCRFEYQPPLDPLGLPGVDQEVLIDGFLHKRPWRVCGSYAVERADRKRNGVYQTGKFCHIYRPYFTDALGNVSWAELSIVGTELTISPDPVWLDNATYPVVMDPDFGYTTAPATALSAEGQLWGQNHAPASSGTTDSISVYVRETAADNTHQFQVALYNAAGTSLLGNSATAQNATTVASWKTVTLSGISVTSGTNYGICFMAGGGGGAIDMYYDATSGVSTWGNLITFPTWPATLTAGSTARNWGIYATYTESGGATTRGTPFGGRGTAFNGGRTFNGIVQ